jgi:LacI family transcriptional regulator
VVTIKDVARLAGVSVTTVSAALSGKAPVSETLQKRVWDAVRQSNYHPNSTARNLRQGTSTTVGLVVPDIATPWSAHLAKALQRAFSARGYHMLLSSNDDDPEREFREIAMMAVHRVAGLIIAPTSLGDNYAQRLVGSVSMPAILVDRVVPGSPFDAVTDDNLYGAQLITRYLLRLGHRDIAFLVGRPGISASYERFNGFEATMAAEGVAVRGDLIHHAIHRQDLAYDTAQQLMSLPNPPTVIICLSISQLLGVMAGLKNMGLRVPDDVSVISFDGFHPADGWYPAITSLTQDIDRVSAEAAEMLLRRIDGGGPDAPEVVRIRPRLEIRESCRER